MNTRDPQSSGHPLAADGRAWDELARSLPVVPLQGVDPHAGDDDLGPFCDMVGSARLVAIGEATHGVAEFHQMRHRLVRALVEHCGFRLLGLEAGWAECLALNRYVVEGIGTAAEAVSSTGYWMWDVWEFRGLVDRLHQHNASLPREQRVRVFGCDAPSGKGAARVARDLMTSVDPVMTDAFDAFWPHAEAMTPFEPISAEEGDRFLAEVVRLRAAVNGHPGIRQVLDDEQWHTLKHALTILEQVHARRTAPHQVAGWSARDEVMAANVVLEMDRLGGDCRAVVLAHNGHVTRDARGMFDPSVVTMGQHLAHRFGADLISIGMMFGEGAFGAMVDVETGSPRLDEIQVGPPPAGSLHAKLAEACPEPALLLDLRSLPSAMRAGVDRPLVTREAGAAWEGEPAMHSTIHAASRHDLLAFVRQTTRSHPTPTGLRPRPEPALAES